MMGTLQRSSLLPVSECEWMHGDLYHILYTHTVECFEVDPVDELCKSQIRLRERRDYILEQLRGCYQITLSHFLFTGEYLAAGGICAGLPLPHHRLFLEDSGGVWDWLRHHCLWNSGLHVWSVLEEQT